jgi:hypothetical protein
MLYEGASGNSDSGDGSGEREGGGGGVTNGVTVRDHMVWVSVGLPSCLDRVFAHHIRGLLVC